MSLTHLLAVALRAADHWQAYAAMLLGGVLVGLGILWPVLAHLAGALAGLGVLQ